MGQELDSWKVHQMQHGKEIILNAVSFDTHPTYPQGSQAVLS